MDKQIDLDDIIQLARQADTRDKIEYCCNAFRSIVEFDSYLLLGSVFTSLVSPPTCVIGSLDRQIRNKKQKLDEITQACLQSSTPVIAGNFNKDSVLYKPIFTTLKAASRKRVSISFPIHFPMGKFAFLHLSLNNEEMDSEQKVFSTLVPGNRFAKEIGLAVLNYLESELESHPPYLNPRERECLLLASEGNAPDEIGRRVGLSAHTVTFHLKKAREKLHSKSITGAISRAMLCGDIETQLPSEKRR